MAELRVCVAVMNAMVAVSRGVSGVSYIMKLL